MKGSELTAKAAVVSNNFLDVLFLVFLVLKLTNVIDWSWWWVTAPIWIPIAAIVAILVLAGILLGVAKLVE